MSNKDFLNFISIGRGDISPFRPTRMYATANPFLNKHVLYVIYTGR